MVGKDVTVRFNGINAGEPQFFCNLKTRTRRDPKFIKPTASAFNSLLVCINVGQILKV
jgi:hypothetical protein